MTLLVVGVVVFVGMHSLRIVGLRDRMVERMGKDRWQGLFSLVVLGAMVAMVVGYGQARRTPTLLWMPTPFMRSTTLVLMAPVFPLMNAAYTRGHIRRSLRHPMMMGTVLWAGLHLLSNGMVHDLVLFGGLLAWSAVWVALQKPASAFDGPARWTHDVAAVVSGLLSYGLTLGWLHRWLIGVAVI
mgnify:FL=1